MTTKQFSRGEALQFGWDVVKNNIGFFIRLMIVVFVILVLPYANIFIKERIVSLFFSIVQIVLEIILIILQMGLIKIALKFCDNEKSTFADLFSSYPLFFNYLIGSILYVVIIGVGLILFIIPGIILAIQFQFFSFFIVDRGLSPIEALKKSSEITKGIKWDLFLFDLLIVIINFLGSCFLGIGLLITFPITLVSIAFVYRKLQSQIETTQT
jgi:uncharacterized membrane protein